MSSLSSTKVAKNLFFSFAGQMVYLLLGFVQRTVFIHTLGTEYLGVNGLFSNILTLLNLAELGVGNAIIYNLYKPVAQNDHQKIQQLIRFYSKAYQLITLVVLVVSVSIMPFLTFFMNGTPNISENIYLVYFLYVINTLSSYFYAYKRTMIMVEQDQYLISNVTTLFGIAAMLLQAVLLFLFHKFLLFLLVQILLNYGQGLCIKILADKKYPVSKISRDRNPQNTLPPQERKQIFKDIRALMLYKISGVIVTGTDNILISKFVGLTTVGLYSNYMLIVSSLQSVLTQVFNSLTASIGHINATVSREIKEKTFELYFFTTFLIYGAASVCLFTLLNPFIGSVWLGQEFLFDQRTVLIITLNFYISGIQASTVTFRNTLGLFIQGKYRPLFSAVLNLLASLVLGYYIGINGVLLGTIISRLAIAAWFDPLVIYRNEFHTSVLKYYKKYLFYLLVLVVQGGLTTWLCGLIPVAGILGFILKGLLCVGIIVGIDLLLFFRDPSFLTLLQLARSMIRKILKRT